MREVSSYNVTGGSFSIVEFSQGLWIVSWTFELRI